MSHTSLQPHRNFNATEAKNRFGAILKIVRDAQPVFIEKHGAVFAVILDIDSYNQLLHKAREPHEVELDVLREEFESMYARMQAPREAKVDDALFSASAHELARAAAKAMKQRG